MKKEFNLKHNTKRQEKEYWIDRLGKLHKFNGDLTEEYTSFHYEIAALLYPESNRPTDILMYLGWIMVGSTVYSHPIINKKPTQAQINKLHSLDLYKRLTFLHDNFYVPYEKYHVLCK
jgi:hypothetical protein